MRTLVILMVACAVIAKRPRSAALIIAWNVAVVPAAAAQLNDQGNHEKNLVKHGVFFTPGIKVEGILRV